MRRNDHLKGVQVRKIFTTRRRIVIAGASAAVVVAASGGAAYAYFTAGGSGSGSGSVGTAADFTITQVGSTTGGPLFPGSGTEVLTFSVANNSGQSEVLNGLTASVANSGGDVMAGTSSIGGCLATWFNASVADPTSFPITVDSSSTPVSVTVDLTMKTDTANQDSCEGLTDGPVVNLTANA
jgi:hypothetical protein